MVTYFRIFCTLTMIGRFWVPLSFAILLSSQGGCISAPGVSCLSHDHHGLQHASGGNRALHPLAVGPKAKGRNCQRRGELPISVSFRCVATQFSRQYVFVVRGWWIVAFLLFRPVGLPRNRRSSSLNSSALLITSRLVSRSVIAQLFYSSMFFSIMQLHNDISLAISTLFEVPYVVPIYDINVAYYYFYVFIRD
ncbi:unnamed protein product [Haemonchus placei]|uniref:7TM_GPCR_Srx domain-containing protein n=1 Tax=Haemonchus placei TaxID=6290 RepID=A0A3P7XXN8_HAEPC|nr:unnamed protein product [Haemonchus placei]